MGYHLLTGATGLLGSRLLLDFALADIPTAVLTRASKLASARQRIESIMWRWDKQAGRALPRPVILEGSLSDDRFGLTGDQLDWVGSNCTAIVQNAASVTYYGKTRNDDPWRTNVTGTKNALEFCRRTGIRNYQHVSTAYVCGRRAGPVFEHELGVGQEMNTDYERSKFEGEVLVREATHIDPPTIHRAAIIIGDSRTGYTPTFHGYYVPLKLVHTMFKRIMLEDFKIAPLLEAIKIEGEERKNLVPVDWVSAVMTHVIRHPEHHGKTYHLAPERPVTSGVMRDSMVQAFMQYGDMNSSADKSSDGSWSYNQDQFVDFFRDQMRIYESYWSDDPTFDLTNTKAAAPHLPCPDVDTELLIRLCKYAIESNFGWPVPAPVVPAFDANDFLHELCASDLAAADEKVALRVTGTGGGDWALWRSEGDCVAARPGHTSDCRGLIHLNSTTFERLARKELSVSDAIRSAQIIMEGGSDALNGVTSLFQRIVESRNSITPAARVVASAGSTR